ncbi:MAG: Phosphoesterase [uncultured Sulfurovum sp.]|uniref:Phosphoesterase n=1 Tax=uncultured Sulfurovum sp. TaxID=269237 RepID=A0A6S6SK68_9BACT|nr:MAG: Phosphoesterase [uncultured Sulfurovum sp.]
MLEEFTSLLEKHDKVSIITHSRANGGTLGTGLGIYAILKNLGKQVEICNVNKKLPNHLDFLPHFAKIKNQIDFDNSLIITCESYNIDILGFDLSSKVIVNIDDGAFNIIDSAYASSSMVAYELLKHNFKVTKEVATCFYVGLVSDTQNFTRLNVTKEVFTVASELLSFEINLQEINRNLTQKKSLSSLRVLSEVLGTLELDEDAQIASMIVNQEILEKTGASLNDMAGIIDYGISLITVKIAILLMRFEDGIKVSFRSTLVDVSSLAIHFGGGGDLMASGFRSDELDMDLLLTKIKKEIKKRGLINGS